MSSESHNSNRDYKNRWIIALVFIVGFSLVPLISLSLLSHPPEYDELLHVLAARGINETGEPVIADGLYDRAQLYSELVAVVAQQGDLELVASRLPALLSGALLVALIGAWVAGKFGALAGLATAGTLAILPDTIHLSNLVRFYTLHALLMSTMLICIFETLVVKRKIHVLAALVLISLLAFTIGNHLQELSQVTAVAGMSAAMAILVFDHWEKVDSFRRKYPWRLIISSIILVAAVFVVAEKLNVYGKLRGSTPDWSISKANDLLFYVKNYTTRLPFLWPIFPILVIFAFFKNQRATLFFTVVLCVSLGISSIASQKATRYIYHLAPSFAILTGIGLSSAIGLFSNHIRSTFALKPQVSLVLALLIFAACMLNTTELQRVVKLATGKGTTDKTLPFLSEPDWGLAYPDLSEHLSTADQVVVTSGVKGLYAFGRYDYELSKSVIHDTLTKDEFGYDIRTGKYVISSPESVQQVLNMRGSVLVVLENRMLNQHYSAPTETVSLIEKECTSLSIPTASQLSAWLCY